jgi:hypothetical protein
MSDFRLMASRAPRPTVYRVPRMPAPSQRASDALIALAAAFVAGAAFALSIVLVI